MSNIVLINRGQRTYTLQPITKTETVELADGTKVKREVLIRERLLLPGQSIETLNDAEAKLYLSYRDIADAAAVVPANASKIKDMQAEIDRLTAANARLSAPENPSAEEAPAAPEGKPSPKKKGK